MIYEVVYRMYSDLKEGNRIEIPKGCLVLWSIKSRKRGIRNV